MKSPKAKSARATRKPIKIMQERARAIWIDAQRLNKSAPFGSGPDAVAAAIAQLGYVQIDTINVIERCHHHILYNRIPTYQRSDLAHAQSDAKTVFEFWTHALSYIPVDDFRYFIGEMKTRSSRPGLWSRDVEHKDILKIVRRVRKEGALTISDIKDDKPVDKTHLWASRKPSKRLLEAAFYNGRLVIAQREGMLKTYELTERHFGWDKPPKPATERQIVAYLLDRALRSQGIVSLDSICHLNAKAKKAVADLIAQRVRTKKLVPVEIAGAESIAHWTAPETLEADILPAEQTHILSPFDPLIIQRKRTHMFFDYEHLFEAYVPKEKRKMGYFTLPVLMGDEIVAALDLKADRQNGELLIQAWHWVGKGDSTKHKATIEFALERFEAFQLAGIRSDSEG